MQQSGTPRVWVRNVPHTLRLLVSGGRCCGGGSSVSVRRALSLQQGAAHGSGRVGGNGNAQHHARCAAVAPAAGVRAPMRRDRRGNTLLVGTCPGPRMRPYFVWVSCAHFVSFVLFLFVAVVVGGLCGGRRQPRQLAPALPGPILPSYTLCPPNEDLLQLDCGAVKGVIILAWNEP